jgi:hypothetical protein
VVELLQLLPDFKQHGRETIGRYWRYQQPVEIVLEELHRLGMETLSGA